MALQGTLDTFALADLVRLLATTSKTGELVVDGDRGTGRLWFADGFLVGGEPAGDGGTADAVFALLRFSEGHFAFEADVAPPEGGVPGDAVEVLGEAEARIEAWRPIEAVVPSPAVALALREELADEEVRLDRDQWRLVTTVAGGCTAADVAAALGLDEVGAATRIKALVDLGAVEVGPEVEPEPEPEVALAAEEADEEADPVDLVDEAPWTPVDDAEAEASLAPVAEHGGDQVDEPEVFAPVEVVEPPLDTTAVRPEVGAGEPRPTLRSLSRPEPRPRPEITSAPEPLADLAPEPLADLAPEPLADLAPEPLAGLAPEPLPEEAAGPLGGAWGEPDAEEAPALLPVEDDPVALEDEPVTDAAPQPLALDDEPAGAELLPDLDAPGGSLQVDLDAGLDGASEGHRYLGVTEGAALPEPLPGAGPEALPTAEAPEALPVDAAPEPLPEGLGDGPVPTPDEVSAVEEAPLPADEERAPWPARSDDEVLALQLDALSPAAARAVAAAASAEDAGDDSDAGRRVLRRIISSGRG
ncbi:DUF4388 domain-containing protein [Iamia majanohamensis]|uniref:DUF4388 domain-containing protein n=1 Tax=Iamia majanohamensis TaxID=467976 RepID=A0AAE9YD40_9ACTN|nr:DUF4388 domain-containing protein [Iamia majanohamensis]WCO69003.1 DUF4388 domain-containing protein [Iamia majanohamensis]